MERLASYSNLLYSRAQTPKLGLVVKGVVFLKKYVFLSAYQIIILGALPKVRCEYKTLLQDTCNFLGFTNHRSPVSWELLACSEC